MPVKDAEIKIRVTKEQKELIKRIAKAKGMTMSEFIVVTTERTAMKKDLDIKLHDITEQRAINTDKNLEEIKIKMISRRERYHSKKRKFYLKIVDKIFKKYRKEKINVLQSEKNSE